MQAICVKGNKKIVRPGSATTGPAAIWAVELPRQLIYEVDAFSGLWSAAGVK